MSPGSLINISLQVKKSQFAYNLRQIRDKQLVEQQ